MQKKPRASCPVCNKPIENRQSKYCNSKCFGEARHKAAVEKWLSEPKKTKRGSQGQIPSPVRKWLERHHNNRCQICGWGETNKKTGKVPLQVHHKNGIADDHTPENLQLLCPNCHSLTCTFGFLNAGHGRKNRHKRV